MRGIECEELRKAYGEVKALDGVSFVAEPGEILALLGPNGSGKTTTVRILTTLSTPDSGCARVAGRDVVRDAPRVRRAIGLTAQETILDSFLTGGEYLDIVARLRHIPRARRKEEIAELLTEFELDEIAKSPIGGYSGGMRRRLDVATSLIGKPRVLFLDEPSTGLDPHSRERMWDAIRRRAHEGATVLLTTQYMEEADALAGSVVVLTRGRIIERGTPDALKDNIGSSVVELTLADPDQRSLAITSLAESGEPSPAGEKPDVLGFVLVKSSPSLLTILQRLSTDGIEVTDVMVSRPTLDEAFLHLTRKLQETPEPQPAGIR
jgi:daunorubicin resistance ABC transporter ATP-binding subunit